MSLQTEIPVAAEVVATHHAGVVRRRSRFEHLASMAEVIGDFAAAAIGLIGAYGLYRVLGAGKQVVYSIQTVAVAAAAFALLFVLMLDREGAYGKGSGILRVRETERILRTSVQAFLLLLPVSLFSEHLVSRWVLGLGFLLVPIAVVTEKQVSLSVMRSLHNRGKGVRKAIIYGAGFTGKRVFSALIRSTKLGINPLVFVDDSDEHIGKKLYSMNYHHDECAPVVRGPVTSRLVESYGATIIVVAIPSIGRARLAELTAVAKETGAILAFVPSQPAYDDMVVDYLDIDGVMLATLNHSESMFIYERTKRVFDLLMGITASVILSPILAFIALAVHLDSEGPIIFKQQRVGKDGRFFAIYKFRTMGVDTPKYHLSPVVSTDQRITRLGRILRKTSLDELPQILNVIKGEMSFVGPRPEMPFITKMYGSRERLRLSVIPGITGLWQLSADRAYLIHENIHYDLYYIRNRGLFMDMAIMMHTAMFAIRGV